MSFRSSKGFRPPSPTVSEEDDVALIPKKHATETVDPADDGTKWFEELSTPLEDQFNDDESDNVPRWYQCLTPTELGLVLTDFVILITTLGLLSFVCLIAMMDGQELDTRYVSFQDALTVVCPPIFSQHVTRLTIPRQIAGPPFPYDLLLCDEPASVPVRPSKARKRHRNWHTGATDGQPDTGLGFQNAPTTAILQHPRAPSALRLAPIPTWWSIFAASSP
jgi:hypothetical protein